MSGFPVPSRGCHLPNAPWQLTCFYSVVSFHQPLHFVELTYLQKELYFLVYWCDSAQYSVLLCVGPLRLPSSLLISKEMLLLRKEMLLVSKESYCSAKIAVAQHIIVVNVEYRHCVACSFFRPADIYLKRYLGVIWPISTVKSTALHLHCKKRFAIFPSPAGMSLTKLSQAGNN